MKTGNFPGKKNARRIRAVNRLKFSLNLRQIRDDELQAQFHQNGWTEENQYDRDENKSATQALITSILNTTNRTVSQDVARSQRK